MPPRRLSPIALALLTITILSASTVFAQDPATRPTAGFTDKLPHLHVDLEAHQVIVDCESLNVDAPLEFFCVTNGGNEHEAVLRTPAKPSDIHFALLMLGLTPGAPATFSESRQMWIPPYGARLHITCRYQLDGKTIEVPAYRMMRSLKDQKAMPSTTWVFDGSRVMNDGMYAADVTGYVVSICNFDLTLIDVPQLVSNANETLEWECNPATVPPRGTPVSMIIEPTSEPTSLPANQGVPASQFNPGPGLSAHSPAEPRNSMTTPDARPAPDAQPSTQPAASGPSADAAGDADVARMKQEWLAALAPHRQAMRDAAQTHYQIIAALRERQQRLIDEADRIQRTIDELDKAYQDLTTPDLPPAAGTATSGGSAPADATPSPVAGK